MPLSNHSWSLSPKTAIAATLRQNRMFSSLNVADLERVAESCVLRVLQKNEVIFHEGQPADGFYIVQSGQVCVYRTTPEGNHQIISIFRAPQSFAEVALGEMSTFPVSASALEPSSVIFIRKNPFRERIMKHPDLALNMIATMSVHLKNLVQLLQDVKERSIESRLAEWLLRHCPAAEAGCPAIIDLPMTKKVLAGKLGVTSETLSRTLGRFRDDTLIRVNGPRITILQPLKLKAIANGP